MLRARPMGRSDPILSLTQAVARRLPASSDFDLAGRPAYAGPRPSALRPAAVLVAVDPDGPGGPSLVLTRRASGLRHHAGQIAFPGGKIDAGDASPEAAALREASEEVGLAPASVSLIGQLAPHETVTGYSIVPVVGLLAGAFEPRADRAEVSEVFAVPLAHVLDPANYRVEQRRLHGEWRPYWVVPWGPYYVWGATARILRGLAERAGG